MFHKQIRIPNISVCIVILFCEDKRLFITRLQVKRPKQTCISSNRLLNKNKQMDEQIKKQEAHMP